MKVEVAVLSFPSITVFVDVKQHFRRRIYDLMNCVFRCFVMSIYLQEYRPYFQT